MNELDNYLNGEVTPSIEELLMENVEQAELIQKLLSEKSELQQIVQEQKLLLQELKEKIVTLNNSDLQLREAEQMVRKSKQKLAEAVRLERKTIEADRSRKQLYEKSVRDSMEQQFQKREKALCKAYKLKEIQLYAVTVGGVLYSFYVTVLSIISTVRFKSDLKAVIEGICIFV